MEPQTAENMKGSARLGSYLRRLRAGYGYSLRKVEERARASGGEIDNSQLSRYEKGICYPSFDKLRVLAGVFNVSIQSFSDVVDLEAFEDLKPADGEPTSLIQLGAEAVRSGDTGRAFATFEKAIDLLLDQTGQEEALAEARVHQAAALRRLGKLALAEQELRSALRAAERIGPDVRARALLALANIHADQGDMFLGELEAERAYELADRESLGRLAAMALHTLAYVLAAQGRDAEAIERFREASGRYAECGEPFEALRVRINVGACYVTLGKVREGIRLLRAALDEARAAGYRRLEAAAWSRLGKAYWLLEDTQRARACLRESDGLAGHGREIHGDLLFFNAFYDWKMAQTEENPTRARIALGRLKALRSGLERRMPEVEEFDTFMERGRCHA